MLKTPLFPDMCGLHVSGQTICDEASIFTLLYHGFKEIYIITGNKARSLFMINNGLNNIKANAVLDPC